MKTSRFLSVLPLWIFILLSSPVLAQEEPDKDFDSFLKKFTANAEFQYSRVRFPLKTPIYLLKEDDTEEEVPFAEGEWVLLGADDLKEYKKTTSHGILFGQFSVKEENHVEYEAGLEESELDLSVVFDRIDGKWYVTDCYNSWYGEATTENFDATVYEAQQKNQEFIEKHP